jgi:hypothetical protein
MTVENMLSALPSTTGTPGATDPGVIVRTVGADAPGGIPVGATMFTASSGNVANASAAATITATASVLGYCTGFAITGAGATAGQIVNATVTGLLGGTMTFSFGSPTGVTVMATPLVVSFPKPIPASAVNTAIVVTLPALGAGNTNAAVMIHGFKI